MAIPHAQFAKGEAGEGIIRLDGSWDAAHGDALERLVAEMGEAAAHHDGALVVILDRLVSLDTLGAYLVFRLCSRLAEAGRSVRLEGATESQKILIEEVSFAPPPAAGDRRSLAPAYDMLSDVGEAVVDAGRDLSNGVAFFGAVVAAFGRLLTGRTRLRIASVVTQLERVGLRSVPIIMLISFLVGAIIAQQSIFQLRTFGTVQFVADLLGILVLRELAVLLTAIMIAGRSGSSFTAELGSMKMREEVDALQTMGLDPLEVLVVPRILALMIALPLLTFLAAMAGIAGGAVVAFFYGGVSSDVFFSRLQNAIGLNTFMVGMIKAPFMALVIGLIACIEGFAVRGSAESLGSHTTASVVKSIFVVIVVDGMFAMFFAAINY
ncbi:ABC transporter permease [Rhabdaerophilum sp. SD176]|uniref:MlaE family ABC transporter permease n=1 Tax=Rhabdaerophilum sp. SD176 TaxID=2983548 RepID=UPI0024E033F4|nr:ABC transporter permease [Rhabdaerophilum sp. SD176]